MIWSLQIECEPAALRSARSSFRAFLEQSQCPSAAVDPIVLAVDEACANVYRHAYGGQSGELRLRARWRSATLRVLIKDLGRPVDVENLPVRNLEEIRPGGLGLPIIQSVFDRVEYRPRRLGTLLILEKTIF